MLPWVIALAILNALDAFSTFLGVRTGQFCEVNPVMAHVISCSPWIFLAVKLIFTIPIFWLFTRAGGLTSVFSLFIKGLTVVYACVIVRHAILWICYSMM